jgi:glutamyl-tRNA reductase
LHQRDAPIAAREVLAESAATVAARGALALVTCHRVELLAVLETASEPRAWLAESVASLGVLDAVVQRTGADAVHHLFRIAAGLDSAIPGERQILSQLRRSYGARASGLHPLLAAAVERALHLGRLLRATTALGSVTRSIGSLAVDELLRLIRDPANATVLIVGAGEVGKLASRALSRRVARILVVSRGGRSARQVADMAGGEALALGDLGRALAEADGVISAADTRGEVLTAERLRRRLALGELALVDIAMPRSLTEEARSLDGLRYRTVDDLTADTTVAPGVVEEGEAACARAADAFMRERAARDAAPVIAALHARADTLRRRQLERALAKLGHLSQRDRDVVAGLARALTGSLLHEPTVALRNEPSRATAARELFGIER